jgi:hypothetical protein
VDNSKVQSRIDAFGKFLPMEKHHHYFDNKTESSPFLQSVSPSTQPLDSRMPVPLVLGQVPGGVTFDDVSQTTVSALASSSSHRSMGVDLLEHFFPDDPSFLFLIFEEIHPKAADINLNKNTEKHVLHPERRNHLKWYHILSINPNGNQYLVRQAGKHVHYGVWRPQLCIILETLELLGLLGCVVPYVGNKSHNTAFAIIRNGHDDTLADSGFQSFDFDFVQKQTTNVDKGSRANYAESYGYSTTSFEPTHEKASGHYRPALKANTVGNAIIAKIFLSMSETVRDMDKQGRFHNESNDLVGTRRSKFSLRIGMEAGLSQQQSELIIGEGLTIFSNHVPSHFLSDNDVQASGIDKKKSWEASSLRHLELEINAFLEEMPIKPHTDRHNCPHPNFDILACSSKCFRKSDGTVSRIGGLLYFRDVCSFFMSRQDIGDVIQLHIENKINNLPIELKVVLPHVTDLLKSRRGGGIFSCPPHANKCMYFSILVDRINLVSRVHELTLPRRVELCSIVLALNGMDLPWSILTGWAKTKKSLPKDNLFMAFVQEATEMNNGTICSSASFRRCQPSVNSPMTLAQILQMNQVSS